ncbi:MAG: hypothetical protein JNJ40_05740 [Bacteroidia bacterium]|nr:hypothetical protein [Bacteroidia bacterium]
MKLFLTPFALLVFILSTSFSFGQNYKTEVKMIDASNQAINAGLSITQIAKSDMDALVEKINQQSVFTIVEKEFFAEKSYGRIHLKSVNKTSIKDFETFLKQLEIYTVVYKNQTISSQEIAANYTEPNRTEVKKIDRIK